MDFQIDLLDENPASVTNDLTRKGVPPVRAATLALAVLVGGLAWLATIDTDRAIEPKAVPSHQHEEPPPASPTSSNASLAQPPSLTVASTGVEPMIDGAALSVWCS